MEKQGIFGLTGDAARCRLAAVGRGRSSAISGASLLGLGCPPPAVV